MNTTTTLYNYDARNNVFYFLDKYIILIETNPKGFSNNFLYKYLRRFLWKQ